LRRVAAERSGVTIVLFVVVAVLLAVIGWLLRPGPSRRRGGTLDLSPAAARGELDLDWSDPRDRVGIMSDAEQADLVADFARRYDARHDRLTATASG
jgi:hypothetical protein